MLRLAILGLGAAMLLPGVPSRAQIASDTRGISLGPGASVSVRELAIPEKASKAFEDGTRRLYKKSDFKGSIGQFERAIRVFPKYYEAYALMGIAYMEMDELARAEEALRKSFQLSGRKYLVACVLLSKVLFHLRRFSEAEAVAREGLELDSNSWQAHAGLGWALFGQRRTAEAEKSAARAAELNPGFAEIHVLLADIHLRLRKYPAVLEDMNHYLTLAPNGRAAAQIHRMQPIIQANLRRAETNSGKQSASEASP